MPAALTVDNVCRVILELGHGLKEEIYTFGTYFSVPPDLLLEIEDKYHDQSDQLREVISYILKTDPAISWRRIIWEVEVMREPEVAYSMRHLAEPGRGMAYFMCRFCIPHTLSVITH